VQYQGFDVSVEVTVKEGDSSKERGDLLENLAKRALLALQHEHVRTEVRVTGCELDLIATESQTGKRIVLECKAYRDRNISADILTKMLGNVVVHDYDSAWLLTTSRLGKDAAGTLAEIRASPAKSKLLRIYDSESLINLLVSTGQIVSPDKLALPTTATSVPHRTLLITDIGEYWAVSVLGDKSGVADTVLTYEAKSGAQVTNDAVVRSLSERDSNLRDLAWVSGSDKLAAVSALHDAALRIELDNIAAVPVADDWSDYRPSRPQDFVGRDDILSSIIDFFTLVAERKSDTRLLAIKAPSGWGKSSFLVKLRSTCSSARYRDRIFLYSVDCRTASSSRYPELALKKCIEEAKREAFIKSDACPITSAGQPFADHASKDLLAELRDERKVIVLFFDQFEEITTKQELSDLFTQVKSMCSAVESAAENVVLGFSWKTDGTIPTDHPAYHVWHSFADRRREFELPLFSKQDTSKLLNRLSGELKQPIEVWLRRLLTEHSQGYPWLLKKLCVHVFRVLQSQPKRQRELFERALDVEALFQRDLADVDTLQYACLEKIAKDSPADSFQITEQFGDAAVTALMQRRLVLRNAGKLIVYWDIFRDYVLRKQVPAIPTRYVPVSSPVSAKRVLSRINHSTNTQLATLSRRLSLKSGTLDNIARDLVMMGVCRYDRKNSKVSLVHVEERLSLSAMFKFFNNHVFLRALIEEHGPGFQNVPFPSIETALAKCFDLETYEANTIHGSIIRWLGWTQALGILSLDSLRSVTHNIKTTGLAAFDEIRMEQRAHRGGFIFKGEAPPGKVVAVVNAICLGTYYQSPEDRNALMVLRSLRLIPSTTQPIFSSTPPNSKRELWLALAVFKQPVFQSVQKALMKNSSASSLEIGQIVADHASTSLSDASKKRYGTGLLSWVAWFDELIQEVGTPGGTGGDRQ